ncbi:radical SAM/SPASM domain-containing protein [Streptomyces sp. RKAG293]|uniref:radical SAM protein n=1 Tax=Streptomyces sp. RKAG293 TaxID=2893403 RepID=UPI0020332EC7|nr:radical SAM/SPASM domain-containing protein [Streptomyces sp. RKAG293]MCM2420317.1 radical SAM/SPASM domain-containing protein [Streptomyces sp. RKAG293]
MSTALEGILSVELEITGTCQLRCSHCCTDSGPKVSAGAMTRANWQQVIADIAKLGIPAVQFIGGEPTLSPHLPRFIDQALDAGLKVEVYSNLTHVRPGIWSALNRPGVCLATSYYSDDAAEHEQITNGPGSYTRTRTNIIEAVRRGIPLRAGIVEVIAGQRIAQAKDELRSLGVTSIQVDRARQVGRAAPAGTVPGTSELCGHCFRHRVSVSPDGEVSGCILSRFMIAGNVREQRLADILGSDRWAQMTSAVPAPRAGCSPDDSGDCDPANTTACDPAYDFAPAPSLGVIA